MRITRDWEFRPITITLETQEELKTLLSITNPKVSVLDYCGGLSCSRPCGNRYDHFTSTETAFMKDIRKLLS
jgi:hypothetical protein